MFCMRISEASWDCFRSGFWRQARFHMAVHVSSIAASAHCSAIIHATSRSMTSLEPQTHCNRRQQVATAGPIRRPAAPPPEITTKQTWTRPPRRRISSSPAACSKTPAALKACRPARAASTLALAPAAARRRGRPTTAPALTRSPICCPAAGASCPRSRVRVSFELYCSQPGGLLHGHTLDQLMSILHCEDTRPPMPLQLSV